MDTREHILRAGGVEKENGHITIGESSMCTICGVEVESFKKTSCDQITNLIDVTEN